MAQIFSVGTATSLEARDDHTWQQREWRHDQHVNGVTVWCNSLRHIAVVAGVVHGCTHETVDKNRTGFVVDLVLDRVRVGWDFDDDVEHVRRFRASWNFEQAHDGFDHKVREFGWSQV